MFVFLQLHAALKNGFCVAGHIHGAVGVIADNDGTAFEVHGNVAVALAVAVKYGGHGGGDERLAADFVQFVRGEKPSLACTSIFDSVAGHLCVYLADESRTHGGQPVAVHLD